MIIDTDVLIWYIKGNEKAFDAVEKFDTFSISVITYLELIQGIRNKDEFNFLRKALRDWQTGIIQISEEISVKAMFFIERYYLSHSLSIADALIAATAVTSGVGLLTGNDKHYKMIKELEVKKFIV